MKVVIVSPYASVVPHFDTELDIAQQHLDAGDDVEFINCVGGLANCDANPNRESSQCQQCVGRREMGLKLLQPNTCATVLAPSKRNDLDLKTDFNSVAELINYRVENFDIGYAALSSLVSICRDPEPDLVKYREMVNRFLQSALQTFRQTQTYLARNQPDRVYVFNGRFAANRAVFRAAQAAGIDCFIHERGCDGQHFVLFENHLPHDISAIENLIRREWDDAVDHTERDQKALGWFHDRVNRVERNWLSFVKNQQTGALPSDWNTNRHNVTIFCSSDDEFVAIGDYWRNELYPNQVTAIAQIAESLLAVDRNIHITLRVHPNLTKVNNQRKRDMLGLSHPNLTIIPPDSEIDSYELLRASDCVVSFGSSIGIEAVFWDRPSVLLGPSFYQNLGGVYRVANHAETVELLTKKLAPQSKDGALMYGYWLQTHGRRHKYFRSSGLFDGQFKGQTLYARPKPKTLVSRIRREASKLLLNLPRPAKIG